MESWAAPPALTGHHKWLLCVLVTFFVFVLISSSYLNQGRSSFSSIPSIPSPNTTTTIDLHPQQSLNPSPSTALTSTAIDLHPQSPNPIPEELQQQQQQPTSPNLRTNPNPRLESSTPSAPPPRPSAAPTPKPFDKSCDIFDGRWVYDPQSYPLYQSRRCPFLGDQVSCQKNGRPDSDYEHWRWEANGCQIPRFNGTDMLERLRGKRVVIVGDSINRNQWESLACLLYSATGPKRSKLKISSFPKVFTSKEYGCTVEFYWSPFIVPLENKVLKLETMPKESSKWRGASIMVFNSGHWWTHRGSLKKWSYLERKGELVEDMEGDTAYETAMRTWARWIDRTVDPAKTKVFFRSISPEHKPENNHWCYNQTYPITNETYIQTFSRSMISIVEKTIKEMRTPVKYLNITRLSEYRRDAHTSVYTIRRGKLLTPEQRMEPASYADCSHWCLPGLPDTWNALIYASIV